MAVADLELAPLRHANPTAAQSRHENADIWQPRHSHDGTIAAELTALNLPEGQAAAAVVSEDPGPGEAFFRVLYGRRS
jgi:hypothetical protein